jgi:hypothetical protein
MKDKAALCWGAVLSKIGQHSAMCYGETVLPRTGLGTVSVILRKKRLIPEVCFFYCSTNGIPSAGPRVFCSAEQPEFCRNKIFVSSIPSSAEFLSRKFPTLLKSVPFTSKPIISRKTYTFVTLVKQTLFCDAAIAKSPVMHSSTYIKKPSNIVMHTRLIR